MALALSLYKVNIRVSGPLLAIKGSIGIGLVQ